MVCELVCLAPEAALYAFLLPCFQGMANCPCLAPFGVPHYLPPPQCHLANKPALPSCLSPKVRFVWNPLKEPMGLFSQIRGSALLRTDI